MDQIRRFARVAIANGIDVHSHVIVETSRLGGYGLVAQSAIQEDTVVLRIPQKCTLDLSTLLELANAMKNTDTTGKVAKVINTTLTIGSSFTETAVVRNYIWSMRILQQMRKPGLLEADRKAFIDQYLDILATTNILDVDEHNDSSDSLVQSHIREKRKVAAEYQELLENLPEVQPFLSFEEAFQLHKAVKSRVLEIPHAIEKFVKQAEEDDEDEEEEEGEDFTTNVTLVPILDFANHAEERNAVFDVDRETNDVILRLDKDVAVGDEICISYLPTKAFDMFFRTYGFVPDSTGFFKWKIPHLSEVVSEYTEVKGENYEYIAKWLHIYPYLTVIRGKDGKIWLDLSDFKLPLLLIRGLHYNADWALKVDSDELSHMYQGTIEEIVEEMRKQEVHSDVVYGPETVYGVTWNGQEVSISSLIEQALEASEDAVNDLIKAAIPVIRSAIAKGLQEDEATIHGSDNTALADYYAFKRALLERVSEFEFDDYMQMIEGVYDIEEE